mgnify:CR=1 FL=1
MDTFFTDFEKIYNLLNLINFYITMFYEWYI